MKLSLIKSIDVYTRWWYDSDHGNPYYARKVVVTLKDESQQVFTVRMTWGGVDNIENDKLEKLLGLPNSVSFSHGKMFKLVNYRHQEVHAIKFTYHDSVRVYRESTLDHPERFKNI